MPGDRLLLNARLASIMGAPVLLALDMRPDASFADHANFAAIARDTVDEAGGDVLGVVLNHVINWPPRPPSLCSVVSLFGDIQLHTA